ncbi:hypothetical protein EB796_002761 [Bugula neritina]|uniref:6-phosphogluconolactonase n=1 Tax=Bugula neritina TaxID=10212 RepID=A0A7J7KKT8_BUGNE|nr:hypothetical protein EB796_002761 [Bugula neritina]
MTSQSHTTVVVKEDEANVINSLSKFIEECAEKAVKDHGKFYLGVSGGSLAKFLTKGLPSISTDWSKWLIFFCDERHVDFKNEDSTYKLYKESLLTKVDLKDEQIIKINPELSVDEAATEYVQQMKAIFTECDWPTFDLLLLGMGPDGHTCSLFPNHPLLSEDSVWVAPIKDSPKPPPCRITMTFPVINRAQHSAFAACGEGKAEMLKRVLEGDEQPPLPAAMVKSATVHWFVDKSAANLLTKFS